VEWGGEAGLWGYHDATLIGWITLVDWLSWSLMSDDYAKGNDFTICFGVYMALRIYGAR
jgi:hypothetical protein